MALEQPPALKAMIVLVCPSDAFVEWPTGTQTLMLIHWHSVTDGRVPQAQSRVAVDWDKALLHLPLVDIDEAAGFRSESWREALAHQTYDDYWAEIGYQQRFAELDLPVLHISGWYDDEAVGTPRHAVNAGQKLGEIDYGPTAVIDQRVLEFGWLDHVLRGADPGDFTDDRPVRIFVMGANEWRDEPSWPPPYVDDTAFYLHADRTLSTDAPSSESQPTIWRHDPFAVLKQTLHHPLTDLGLERFLADWRKTNQKI